MSRGMSPVAAGAVRPLPRIEVYSYDKVTGKDTLVEWTGSAASSDAIAHQAYVNAEKVAAYYRDSYSRDGIDNHGSTIKVRVHAPDSDGSTPMNNARWYNDEHRLWLGDGDGTMFAPLGNALDVVAHEMTHGVVDSEVHLDYDQPQEGALHESFADVLGAVGVDGNYQIGEDAFTPGIPGDALRDLSRPTYDNAKTLPAWVTEQHDLSGIPSLAAVRTAEVIGRDKMLKVWYAGLTKHLHAHAGFSGAMEATLQGAADLYGTNSREYAAVRDAWAGVGVDGSTPKARETMAGAKLTIQALRDRVDHAVTTSHRADRAFAFR